MSLWSLSTQSHAAVRPFNHRAVVLHNLFLYYVRHEHFPKASSVTQCLVGKERGRDQREVKTLETRRKDLLNSSH